MTDSTIEALQAELQKERATNQANAEELAKMQTENEQLKAASNTKTQEAKIVVKGEITLETTVEGKKYKKTYTIAEGHERMWSPNQNLVPTEKVVALATGKDLTKEELDTFPHLKEFVDANTLKSNGVAKQLLTELAQRGASILVEKQ